VEALLVLIDICQRLNFRSFEPVLHSSRCVLSVVEAVIERPFQVYLHWKEVLLVIVDTVSSGRNWFSGRLSRSSTQVAEWRREGASFICCERWNPSMEVELDLFGSSLSGWIELNFATFEPVLHWSRSVESVVPGISVQSSHTSSGITTRNLALVCIFKRFEPVQHQSRSVKSVEASNLGMFPVEWLLGTSQWLNWSTHSLIAVELIWFSGGLSRSYTQVAECGSVQSRCACSWMTARNHSVVELSTHSGWIFEFQDVWTGLASKSLSGGAATTTTTRSISGWIGANHQPIFWISGQLNLSCI